MLMLLILIGYEQKKKLEIFDVVKTVLARAIWTASRILVS